QIFDDCTLFIMKHFNLSKVLTLGLLTIITSGSCTSKPQNTLSEQATHQKIVYEDLLQPSINLTELFNAYEVVVLDDADGQAQLGDITNLMELDDRLIVLDNEIAQAIFVFDRAGNFLFKTERGEGPTQTLSIEDFTIDEDNMQLIILDNGAMSIKFFDLADGNFLQSIKINDYQYGITHTNGKIWLKNSFDVAENKYNKAKIIALDPHDNEDDVSITHLPLLTEEGEAYSRYVAGDIAFLKAGSTIFYAEDWGNKIYSFSENGSLLNQIEIDFGKDGFHNYSDQIDSESDLSNIFENHSTKYIMGMGNAGNSEKIIYTVSNGGALNYFFANADLTDIAVYEDINNDLFATPVMPFIGSSDKAVYMVYRPEFLEYFDSQGMLNEEFKKALGTDFNGSTSNQVLVRLSNQYYWSK